MIISLLKSTVIMLLLIVPGFLLRKTKIDNGSLAKGLSNLILYVMQPAMLMYSFIVTEFDSRIFKNGIIVLLFSSLAHAVFYIISKFLFKKADIEKRKVLRFSAIFSNAGYMGIPLINYILGAEATIYASVYVISFNLFAYSLGFLIYSEDKKYISIKHILINPATIPIAIALLLFVTRVNVMIPSFLSETMEMMKNTVAPLAMTVVGLRLAETKFDGLFNDKYLYFVLVIRHFVFPFILWLAVFCCIKAGLGISNDASSVLLICASTPVAAATSMFAEKFDGESVYASKIVSISTVVSVITMPIMAGLLQI